MSLQHFFLENQCISKQLEISNNEAIQLCLSKHDIKHARALRLKSGEHIGVIDCENVFYECEIESFDKNCLLAKVSQRACHIKNADAPEITLFFGVLKGSKNDEIIRGCSEIGVSKFVPVKFDRCVSELNENNESKKIDRWTRISKSASMQSGQFKFPDITNSVDVEDMANELKIYDCVIVFWEEADSKDNLINIGNHYKNLQNIAVVIGPEGGIAKDEIDKICQANKNYHVVTLSKSILRSQTACIVGCGLVNYLLREKQYHA